MMRQFVNLLELQRLKLGKDTEKIQKLFFENEETDFFDEF
jgi:hypothetical protein